MLGRRLCVTDSSGNQQLGTIRFEGEVAPWPHKECIGVEWDDAELGKNDGSLEWQNQRYRYFETVGGVNSGSFIKLPRSMEDGTVRLSKGRVLNANGRSFMDALRYKYDEDVDMDDQVMIGSKVVEKYGFQEVSSRQADFASLEVVGLDHMMVNNEIGQGMDQLTAVTDLDISYNLIDDWTAVLRVCRALPTLKILRLSGNRFANDTFGGTVLGAVQVNRLSLSSCQLGLYNILGAVQQSFPSLTKIDLSNNLLETFPSMDSWSHLVDVNMSYNSIEGGVSIGSLKALNLANNMVTGVASSTQGVDNSINPLDTLDLSNNDVASWNEIDQLHETFPRLKSLKLMGNPVFNGSLNYDKCLANTLGRIPTLEYVNGTNYTAEQRSNYELYLISCIKNGEFPKPATWSKLLARNGQTDNVPNDSLSVDDFVVTLDVYDHSGALLLEQRVFPHSTTVGKLRGTVSRKLGIGVLHFSIQTTSNIVLSNDQQFLADAIDGTSLILNRENT